jgi:type I site-specific restriction endonuclease
METKLIKQFNDILRCDVDWQLDQEENKIDVYGSSCWGAKDKQSYDAQEALIDAFKIDNDLVKVNCWCDISGYDYWMVDQEESNYVSIDVYLKKKEYTDEEVVQIREVIIETDNYFCQNLSEYLPLQD